MKSTAAVLLTLLSLATSSRFTLTVLHTNDLHSRFDQVTASGSECRKGSKSGCLGGVARIKYAVEDIKSRYPNTVFLNAGDFFQGTVWYSMFKWRVVANMTSSLGYTASSLGNHEFDDGLADLEAFSNAIEDSYPLLACNVDVSRVPALNGKFKPYILTKVGERQIAIIGYVTPETKELSKTEDVVLKDEIESLRTTVAEVQNLGVSIIVAVGHSGYEKDLEIAREVEGLDVIIGGHTNTFLWKGALPEYIKDLRHFPMGSYPTVVNKGLRRRVLVVQTNGYGRYLGQLHVTFDGSGNPLEWEGNPLLLNDTHPADVPLENLVKKYREEVAQKMDSPVGTTEAFIDGGRPKCRIEECSFGNFVTDAMASEMGVDIAVINSGAIKGSFDPLKRNGTITLHDIYTAMPWGNTIDVATVSGKTLRQVLEHAVSCYEHGHPDPCGRFLQVSGLKLTYDVRHPQGQRLISAYTVDPLNPRSRPKAIEDSAQYEVAMPSFLATGGDTFQMIPDYMTDYKNTGFLDNDLLVAYLRKHNPLQLPHAGRIVVLSSGNPVLEASSAHRTRFVLWMFLAALAPTFLSFTNV